MEKNIVDILGFKTIENPINQGVRVEQDLKTIYVIEKYMKERRRPTIFFCDEVLADKLQATYTWARRNDEVLDLLCKLDTLTEGQFCILLLTEKIYMRGVDYRAPRLGLDLIIARSFDNALDQEQGLHRVGRHGDPCDRYLHEVEHLISQEEDTNYRGALYEGYSALKKVCGTKRTFMKAF